MLCPAHVHHARAQQWFRSGRRLLATCPIMQCGFVRIVSNLMFSRDALALSTAAEYLATNLVHPRHRFFADRVPLNKTLASLGFQLQGHQQTTDAYLLGLAHHYRARLATLDKSLAILVSDDAKNRALLEIIGAD